MSDSIRQLAEQTCIAHVPEYYGIKRTLSYKYNLIKRSTAFDNKLLEIKAYKEITGVGIKDAKYTIDWMVDNAQTIIVDLNHEPIEYATRSDAEAKALIWNNVIGTSTDEFVDIKTNVYEYMDGILEALRIAQVNDAVIAPFMSSIQRLCRNAYLQTSDREVIEQYELAFGLNPTATIDERRQAIIDYINRDLTINDATLLKLVQVASGGNLVKTRIDPKTLTLDVCTDADANVTTDQLLAALRTVMQLAPANLAKTATFATQLTRTNRYYHASISQECCELGKVLMHQTHKLIIHWGDTVALPENARLATPIKSKCWWIFGGNTCGSNNNHGKGNSYIPIYADGSETGNVPATIRTAYSNLKAVGEGQKILSGLCANTSTGQNTALETARIGSYQGALEVYSTPAITQYTNTTLTIFEFDIEDFLYPLPHLTNELYHIHGNTIDWIDTGYLKDYFSDKPLMIDYYLDDNFKYTEIQETQFETIA